MRDPKNYKYYIPYDMVARTGEPGKEFFPEYISGNLRISNPGTARAIAEAARVVRFLWLEDVWLTGYIAQYLHIQHLVGTDFALTVMEYAVGVSKFGKNPMTL